MRRERDLSYGLLLLALVVVTGCAAPAVSQPPEPPRMILEPGGEVVVEEAAGQVVFSFLIQRTPGTGDLLPTKAVDLAVKRVGQDPALWFIRTKGTENAAARITYGIVPPGFIQDIPANTPAPKLEKGVTYSVATRWAAERFTFRGD